jgi:lysozyme family protein
MIDQLIDEIIQRESAKDTNNPNDSGGRTKYGLSEKWDPEDWVSGPPTLEMARARYLHRYITQPGFLQVQPDYLMSQLVDWGVLSGPVVAIQHLQKLLGVTVDGQLGPLTLATLGKRDPLVLNNQLVDDRVLMLARVVQKHPTDLEFVFGWQSRALSFRK